MRRNRALIIGVALLLAGTAGLMSLYGTPASVTGVMMGRGGMKTMMQRMMGDVLPPGIDPTLLPEPESRSVVLLTRYCSQCHNLPGPGMHTAEEWPAVVERMNRRMGMMRGRGMMMGGVESPDDAELRVIVRYLQTYAQQPMDRARYKDLDSSAGRVFQSACSRCHALPDPQQHTADEWPSVVARMEKNMAAMGKSAPDEAATEAIVGYLQRHAKAER